MASQGWQWQAQDHSHQLDTMQNMLDEILLETGKQLRACRLNSSDGDIRQVANAINSNTRFQYETFQSNLSDLIAEIQDAKLVFVRDLERLKKAGSVAAEGPSTLLDLDTDVMMSGLGDATMAVASIGAFPLNSLPHIPATVNGFGLGPITGAVESGLASMAPFPDMDGDMGSGDEVMILGQPPVSSSPNQGSPLAVSKDTPQLPPTGSATPATTHAVKTDAKPRPANKAASRATTPALGAGQQGQTPGQFGGAPGATSTFTNIQFTIAAPGGANPGSAKKPGQNEGATNPGMGTGMGINTPVSASASMSAPGTGASIGADVVPTATMDDFSGMDIIDLDGILGGNDGQDGQTRGLFDDDAFFGSSN